LTLLAILAPLAPTVVLALFLALFALMVTIPLRLEPLLVPHAPLLLTEPAPAKVPRLALSALLVMLPLVVTPIASVVWKALGLPMMPRCANSALPVRLV